MQISWIAGGFFTIWATRKAHAAAAADAAKSLQLCPTLWDPRDGRPPGSPVLGILQARTLEWVAISFSNAWKWKVKVKSLSRVRLLTTAWTAAHQAPPSMGVSRQEYWSGMPLPSPLVAMSGHYWVDTISYYSFCVQDSHWGGFSYCRAQALGHSQSLVAAAPGL